EGRVVKTGRGVRGGKAVKHGTVSRIGRGEMEIRADRHGDLLRLRVKDNGPGLNASTARTREGLGLANTRARLQQMYGATHRFEMADAASGGLQVTLELPFETAFVPDPQKAPVVCRRPQQPEPSPSFPSL